MSTDAEALTDGVATGTSVNGPAALKAYWNFTTPMSSVAVMLSVTGLVRYQPLWPVAGDGDSVATFNVGAVASACARASAPVTTTAAAASVAVASARPLRGRIQVLLSSTLGSELVGSDI